MNTPAQSERLTPLRHWKLLVPLTLAALAMTLTRCGKVQDPAAPITSNFSSIYSVVIQGANCTQCHVPGGLNNGVSLDFTTLQTAYTTLTTKTVSGGASVGICGGVKIVTAGDPTKSYLAPVLFQDYKADGFAGKSGCTPYTGHLQDQHLTADEETAIIAWIKAGALNN